MRLWYMYIYKVGHTRDGSTDSPLCTHKTRQSFICFSLFLLPLPLSIYSLSSKLGGMIPVVYICVNAMVSGRRSPPSTSERHIIQQSIKHSINHHHHQQQQQQPPHIPSSPNPSTTTTTTNPKPPPPTNQSTTPTNPPPPQPETQTSACSHVPREPYQ
jgi:hypothetical protein